MMKQLMLNLTLLISLTMAPLSAWANCQLADTLFKQSQQVADNQPKSSLLKQATGLCPNHRDAHYQLAQLQKNAEQWAEAQWLYQHVIEIAPNFAPAYAELGDVLMIRKDYNLAAEMFDNFINLVEHKEFTPEEQIELMTLVEDKEFTPEEKKLEKIKKHYHKRLDDAHDNIRKLSTNSIYANLTNNKGVGSRQMNIQVGFDDGSHQIKKYGETWLQCQEIANKINHIFSMTEFENTIIRIEGHTDSIGSAHYNEILSKQRAKRLKEVLVNDFQVPEERLEVIGIGEYQPIASNQTIYGRFLNSRIQLVKINR